MKEFLIRLLDLLSAVARLLARGGAKALVAENLLIKQQLIILTRTFGVEINKDVVRCVLRQYY